MGRDDPFRVRNTSVIHGEATNSEATLNRSGGLIVTDFYTQLLLSGYCFHMQTGTEDAPITTDALMDDVECIIVADTTSGSLIPLFADVNHSTFAAVTTIHIMLEADMDKVRYASGGQVFVPEQMNGAATSADAAAGSFFTMESADIVAAAKSAVPASVELARRSLTEDAVSDPATGQMARTPLFSCTSQTPVIISTPGSVLLHAGASADITAYGSLDFAQLATGLLY